MSEAPVYKSPSNRVRKTRFEELGDARAAIGILEPGCEIFGLTKGQFSLMELATAVLEQTGPATVDVSVWTAAEADLRDAYSFLESGKIKRLRFLVDRSFESRQPDYCREMKRLFGSDCIRVTRTHAKFLVIRNEAWDLAIRTSMNLNRNPRCETFEISDDPRLCDFLGSLMDEFFTGDSVMGSPSPVVEQAFAHAAPAR